MTRQPPDSRTPPRWREAGGRSDEAVTTTTGPPQEYPEAPTAPEDLLDRPALGHYVSRADVVAARDAGVWSMRMSVTDFAARWMALPRLALIHERVRIGARLDLVADELEELAVELRQVPQRHEGGQALREVA